MPFEKVDIFIHKCYNMQTDRGIGFMLDEFNIIKRKKKKNAFASTALLISIAIAVLVIILIVLLMGRNKSNDDKQTNGCNGTTNVTCATKTKEEKFTDNLRTIKDAAVSYFTIERMPEKVGDSVKLTLKEMQQKKLVLDILDSTGKKCSTTNSYVEVTKEENEYVMKLHLSCDDMEDYIVIHLGCYDYCKGTVCEKEVEPDVTEFEYEYKKEVNCKMSDWSDWSEWSTKKQTPSDKKKVETKTETKTQEVVDEKDATMNPTTYNCDKYPGYTLEGDKCVKRTTIKDEKEATKVEGGYVCPEGYTLKGKKCEKVVVTETRYDASENPATYNCNRYPGYTLVGTKCVKSTTSTSIIDANVVYNCNAYPGYTLSGTKCVKTTSSTDTKDAGKTYNCNAYSGYTLSGTKCVKKTTSTDTKAATPEYGTRRVSYTCYKQECTTKTVFSCDSTGCGNKPITSCENVKKTCSKNEQYVSGYNCNAYPGYTLSGDKCTKTTSHTDTKDASVVYNCNNYPGYTLSGSKCTKTTTSTDTKDAGKTYNCNGYSGYSLEGSKCKKVTTVTDEKSADRNPTTYNCNKYPGSRLEGNKCVVTSSYTVVVDATPSEYSYNCDKYSGYSLVGSKCIKETTVTEKEEPTKVPGGYTCPKGYKLNGTKCTKKETKDIKTTYYRFATRTCDGGSVSIKWSTSKNDESLLNDGYKLTGNKKAITKVEK